MEPSVKTTPIRKTEDNRVATLTHCRPTASFVTPIAASQPIAAGLDVTFPNTLHLEQLQANDNSWDVLGLLDDSASDMESETSIMDNEGARTRSNSFTESINDIGQTTIKEV